MRAISILAVMVTVLALLVTGCSTEVELAYNPSPKNVVVKVSSSGGLPTPWVDNVASFTLYGNGRVIKMSNDSRHVLLLEGSLDGDSIDELLRKIEDLGFFDLKREYRNKNVMDGVTTTIAVNLTDTKKAVSNYMSDVPAFTDVRQAIMDFPVDDLHTYVPDKGYLYVRKDAEPPKNPQVPPAEIAALIPPAETLEQAATTRKPVEIDGKSFVSIKKWESSQQYSGADIQSGGTWYKVFPMYQPPT